MKAGHYVILHTFQQNPSTLCCLLLPCVKYGSITRSRPWNFWIYELLQPIVIQHRFHPVLPWNIIQATLEGILQSQSVERHLNFDTKKTLLQIRIPPAQNSTASMFCNFSNDQYRSDTMWKFYNWYVIHPIFSWSHTIWLHAQYRISSTIDHYLRK